MALLLQERPSPLRSLVGLNPKRLVLVADLYLDDSGTHKASPVITMAGYVFSAARLEDFEKFSERLFKASKVPVFHAKEFDKRRSRSPFKGWSIVKQTAFADAWLAIAHRYALRGITISLPKARYDEFRSKHRKNLNISYYGQCLNDVLIKCREDEAIWSLAESEGLAVILELGNKHNDGCVQFFNKIRKEWGLEKELARIGFAAKADCRAIQLADFLAYYSWQHAVDAVTADASVKSVRPSAFLDLATKRVRTLGQVGNDFIVAPPKPRKTASP